MGRKGIAGSSRQSRDSTRTAPTASKPVATCPSFNEWLLEPVEEDLRELNYVGFFQEAMGGVDFQAEAIDQNVQNERVPGVAFRESSETEDVEEHEFVEQMFGGQRDPLQSETIAPLEPGCTTVATNEVRNEKNGPQGNFKAPALPQQRRKTKGPEKAESRVRRKTPLKAPVKTSVKNPAKTPAKAPARIPAKVPANLLPKPPTRRQATPPSFPAKRAHTARPDIKREPEPSPYARIYKPRVRTGERRGAVSDVLKPKEADQQFPDAPGSQIHKGNAPTHCTKCQK